MTRALAKAEVRMFAMGLREDLDVSKYLHENPLNFEHLIFGTTRGLELPAKALLELAGEFGDHVVWVLGIDGRKVEGAIALEVDAADVDNRGNAVFDIPGLPNVFASDLVVASGRSRSWYALFDAELSLGVLVVKRKEDIQRAVAAYGMYDVILSKHDGFRSCIEEEVEPYLPNAKEVAESLYMNWGAS